MSNKSKTYVYPIFHKLLGLILPYNLENTYVYNDTKEDLFTLVYEFYDTSTIKECREFLQLHNILLKSNLLKEIFRFNDGIRIAYTLKVPIELQEHLNKFKNGSYSKFNDKEKYTIVQFLQKYYSAFPLSVENITSILFNNPEYRKEMSKHFGYNIPDNIELSSKPDIILETFKMEILETMNINQYEF